MYIYIFFVNQIEIFNSGQIQQAYVLTGNNSTVTAIDFDNEGVRNVVSFLIVLKNIFFC